MNYLNIYAKFLKKFLKPQEKLKVVFDCSNGTTGLVLKGIINNELGIKNKNKKFIILNSKPDGNFPGHGPDPLAKGAMNQLKKEVLRQKADLGAIFDADGDRVFFIDNLGHFVEPDIIARLLIWHLKPKKVIIDVRAGWLIRRGIMNNELGIKNKNNKSIIHNSKFIIQSKVGHYFIKKLMRKTDADFGAEKTGHYYFKKFFYCDAGILTAIEIINAVSKLPYSLADFTNLLPQYYRSEEINVKMNYESPKHPAMAGATGQAGIMNYEYLFKKFEKKYKNQAIKISRLDGLTMEFSDWWFNLRPSNTELLIRLNIEAKTPRLLKNKKEELIKLLKNVRPENN